MLEEFHEECGIAAVKLKKELSEYPPGGVVNFLYTALLAMQHRGQLSAGFVTLRREGKGLYEPFRDVGTIPEVFRINKKERHEQLLKAYSGLVGITHNRYATTEASDNYWDLVRAAQPFVRPHGKLWKEFGIAFNGNIANYEDIKQMLEKERGYHFKTCVDTELIMHLFGIYIAKEEDNLQKQYRLEKMIGEREEVPPQKPDLFKVVERVSKHLDGAYNIVFVNGQGDLAVITDPSGFKPLCYGENERFFAAASESVALVKLGLDEKDINFFEPGQMILVPYNDKTC